MPKQGITVEACIITEWKKKVGDAVKAGEVLFAYETDKATFECESTEEGELLEIFFANGAEVPVLVNVCAIGKAGEDVARLREEARLPSTALDSPRQPSTALDGPRQPSTALDGPRQPSTAIHGTRVSPRARRTAERHGVDVRTMVGSGPDGRIVEQDVQRAVDEGNCATSAAFAMMKGSGIGGRVRVGDITQSPPTAIDCHRLPPNNARITPSIAIAPSPPPEGCTDTPFTNIRKVIAKAMLASLSSMAQLTNHHSFDASAILSFRAKAKKESKWSGVTLNDVILFAVSRTLPKHRILNANIVGESTLRTFSDVHLGVAIDTERGVMVPNLFKAQTMGLIEISAKVKELAKQAQGGGIRPDVLSGGSFTVTSLGALGVENFTPVINAPQTAILGVGSLVQRVREVGGIMSVYPSMGLSLTYDHRVVDGAPAARFMQDLIEALETFSMPLS